MAFKDYFSRQAGQYTQFRPRYPRELFQFLAATAPDRQRVWDCGTGNGQAAVDLAADFSEVIATDPSERQIAHALPHDRVSYRVAPAEKSGLEDRSVDLVTVAQALHWFDLDGFYREVRRVARPAGILAVWGYGLATINSVIDPLVWYLYEDLLGEYWPPERRLVEAHYTTVPFPFQELPTPTFTLQAEWNLADLIGYLSTWSSVQKFIERNGAEPLQPAMEALTAAWGPPTERQRVEWPLFQRLGKV